MGIGLRGWATRQLQNGDLTTLSAIAKGWSTQDERVKRLSRRGFIANASDGGPFITTRGRVALMIKRLTLR